MKESDIDNLERLKKELDHLALVREQNKKRAEESFSSWQQKTVNMVGRSLGVFLEVPKQKFNKIWKWLIS